MKKLICAMALGLAASAFAGSQTDMRFVFWTKGPDTYTDNTPVLDGEFYALVWSPAEFGGFAADGSLVNEADELIAALPLAKGGRLTPVVLELPKSEAAAYGEGSFSVVLLDTRKADGSLADPVGEEGAKKPASVNSCVTTATVGVEEAVASAVLGLDSPVKLTLPSALPADAPKPVITAVRKEGDSLVLTVKGTAAYLKYNVAGGVTPDAIGSEGKAEAPKDGAATAEDTIELKVPAKGNSGFYKVIRN